MTDRLMGLAAVAARYDISTRTLRRRIAAGDRRVPVPCQVRPFKFKASTVDAHLSRMTVTDQLRAEAREERRASCE